MKLMINKDKQGQAMVEVMVGIIVVMILVSAVLQMAIMSKAHTDVMVEAREKAGELAMFDLSSGMNLLANPDYIKDWHEGLDGRRLSSDDVHDSGNVATFQSIITEATVHDASGWNIIDAAPYNRLSLLRSDPMVVNSMGLVKGTASDTARLDMLPAFRHLVYGAASIDIEATVWMTLCKGLY